MGFLAGEWHVVEVRAVSEAGRESYPAWPVVHFDGLDGDLDHGRTATSSSGSRGAMLRVDGAEGEFLMEKAFEIFADTHAADLRFRLHERELAATAASSRWVARQAYHWLARCLRPSRAPRLADTNSVVLLQGNVVRSRPLPTQPINFFQLAASRIADRVATVERPDEVLKISGGE